MITRSQMHILLDFAMDVNASQEKYDINIQFSNNYDGTPMCCIYVHLNEVKPDSDPNGIVEMMTVSNYTSSFGEAVEMIEKYKEESHSDAF